MSEIKYECPHGLSGAVMPCPFVSEIAPLRAVLAALREENKRLVKDNRRLRAYFESDQGGVLLSEFAEIEAENYRLKRLLRAYFASDQHLLEELVVEDAEKAEFIDVELA